MYAPSVGLGPVMDYIWDTGRNALKGADILKTAPAKYTSTIEYGDDHTAEGLKAAAQVHLAELGTKIITVTTPYNTFDYHANEVPTHARLWREVSRAVSDFYQDLREHATGGEVLLFMFSEFGRRAWDNGGGTDHGTGGVCWIIGDHVRGGLYGDYPSLKREELEDGGDLQHNVDFRRVYATLIEKWLGLDSRPIVGGAFEQLAFLD